MGDPVESHRTNLPTHQDFNLLRVMSIIGSQSQREYPRRVNWSFHTESIYHVISTKIMIFLSKSNLAADTFSHETTYLHRLIIIFMHHVAYHHTCIHTCKRIEHGIHIPECHRFIIFSLLFKPRFVATFVFFNENL